MYEGNLRLLRKLDSGTHILFLKKKDVQDFKHGGKKLYVYYEKMHENYSKTYSLAHMLSSHANGLLIDEIKNILLNYHPEEYAIMQKLTKVGLNMKSLSIQDKEYFGFKQLYEEEENVLEFLKKIDLKKTKLSDIYPIISMSNNQYICNTSFYFVLENGIFIKFYYEENKKISSISIFDDNDMSGLMTLERDWDERMEPLLTSIWEQFVDHFNLRIRLMFLNERTPWDYEKK